MQDIIRQTIEQMFGNQRPDASKGQQQQPRLRQRATGQAELDLAVAVLLVDLASSDQNFDMSEYNIIAKGLHRMFGKTPAEVKELVNRAKMTLGNLRGSSNFAKMLRDNMSQEERTAVMELIEEVIQADGQEDGFETYLRARFRDLLGLEV